MRRQQPWWNDGFTSKGHRKALVQHPITRTQESGSGWNKGWFILDSSIDTFYLMSSNNSFCICANGLLLFPSGHSKDSWRNKEDFICQLNAAVVIWKGSGAFVWKITHKALIISNQRFHLSRLVALCSADRFTHSSINPSSLYRSTALTGLPERFSDPSSLIGFKATDKKYAKQCGHTSAFYIILTVKGPPGGHATRPPARHQYYLYSTAYNLHHTASSLFFY